MRIEHLIYFPDAPAYENGRYLGVLPQHYCLVSDTESLKQAIAWGGRDVSDNDGHWREWERQQNLDYVHG